MVNEWWWDLLNVLPSYHLLAWRPEEVSDIACEAPFKWDSSWHFQGVTHPNIAYFLLLARKEFLRVTFPMEVFDISECRILGGQKFFLSRHSKCWQSWGLVHAHSLCQMCRGTAEVWVLLLPFLMDFSIISGWERYGGNFFLLWSRSLQIINK